MGTSFHHLPFFFKEDYSMSFLIQIFLEGICEELLTLFEMNRHTVEILDWSCDGTVWRKWMAIPGVGDCHTRHFEASNEMGIQRRKTGR